MAAQENLKHKIRDRVSLSVIAAVNHPCLIIIMVIIRETYRNAISTMISTDQQSKYTTAGGMELPDSLFLWEETRSRALLLLRGDQSQALPEHGDFTPAVTLVH